MESKEKQHTGGILKAIWKEEFRRSPFYIYNKKDAQKLWEAAWYQQLKIKHGIKPNPTITHLDEPWLKNQINNH